MRGRRVVRTGCVEALRPLASGRYIFWLAHARDIGKLAPGTYQLEVLASGTRDNTADRTIDVSIGTGQDNLRRTARSPSLGTHSPALTFART
jgi:hypothetical protein